MRVWIHTLLLAATLALCGCNHKELCLVHEHTVTLRLEFDWRDAPDASPAGMCVFFYHEDGSEPERFDFRGREGGTIAIKSGNYRLLCYNNDTESVLFRNAYELESHEGYTREGSLLESIYGSGVNSSSLPRAEGTEEERVVITPDMMWGAQAFDVQVRESGVTYTCVPWDGGDRLEPVKSREQVITLFPHELICTYTYEIRDVKNLEFATQMCGSLSSMSGSLLFWSEELGQECVTLPFEARVAARSNKIVGQFYTFGHHELNTAAHRMMLYVWMSDGKKYALGAGNNERFNVTEQIHNAPDKRHVHLIIEGVELPLPIDSGDGGFEPDIDDWGEVYEDIIM